MDAYIDGTVRAVKENELNAQCNFRRTSIIHLWRLLIPVAWPVWIQGRPATS